MIYMTEYKELAGQLFNANIYKEFMEHLDAFAHKMAITDFDAKTKEKYTDDIEEYYFHYFRTRQLEADFAHFSRESDKFSELYEKTKDPKKEAQYKKNFYETQKILSNIKHHHELAKEDRKMATPAAQKANIAAEERIAELEAERKQKNQKKKT